MTAVIQEPSAMDRAHPHEDHLFPDSLAADGIQAAAKAVGALALVAVQRAMAQLTSYRREADFPPAGIVETADLLDVSLSALRDRSAA